MRREKHQTQWVCSLLLLTTLLFLPVCMHASMPADTQMSINVKSVPVTQVLDEIHRKSGLDIVYNSEMAKEWPRITINMTNKTAEEIIQKVTEAIGCKYEIRKNVVSITLMKSGKERTVKGYVRDENGEPLIGVPVSIGESGISTVTNSDGFYSLRIPVERTTLKFSFVGMETTYSTLPAGTADLTHHVKMHSDNQIEEVVVTGIFQKAKESYTGAVSQITEEQLNLNKGQNLLQTLRNIDASINLTIDNINGSNPNNLPQINIRGNASLPVNIEEFNQGIRNDVNTPLIIMDGFEISLQKLMDYNDEEIESINILKDAAATAIYGSRGANGVIVIISKRPKAGSLKTKFQVGTILQIPDLNSYNLLNAQDKLALEYEAGMYESPNRPTVELRYHENYNKRLAAMLAGANTEWIKKPVHTGIGMQLKANIEGGNEEFRWGAALSYNDTEGAMKGSSRETFNGSVTLLYTLKNLTFRNYTSVGINRAEESKYGSFSTYVAQQPYNIPYDSDGKLVRYFDNFFYTQYVQNPLYDASLNSFDKSGYQELTNNFSIDWAIVDGLTLRALFGISSNDRTSDYFLPAEHSTFTESSEYSTDEGFLRRGLYRYGTGKSTNYDVNATLSYSKLFNNVHMIYAGLNYSLSSYDQYMRYFSAEGFASEDLTDIMTARQYELNGKPSGTKGKSRRVGLTGNINYTLANKYFIDMSYRVDGSSEYGANKKYAPFWSTGVGWNIHNEKFMKNQKTVSLLRMHASYGETGSQLPSNSGAVTTYQLLTGNKYMNWMGVVLNGLGNPDLTWQNTKEWNGGIEFGLWDNRVKGAFDVYDKHTSNLLSSMDLPLSTGFSSYVSNIGEVSNRGFEASLSAYIIKNPRQRFNWVVSGQMVYNKNKIEKLSDAIKAQNEEYLKQSVDVSSLFFEGNPQNAIYAVRSLGIDPSTGQEIFLTRDGELTREWNPSDKVFLGSSDPKYRGNIGSVVSWKGWTLSLSFGYYFGGYTYNSTLRDKVEVTVSTIQSQNVDERVYSDRWFTPGDVTFFKALSSSATHATSRYVMKNNVLDLQSASLQYTWDNEAIRKFLRCNSVIFSVNTSDILHFSTVKMERGISYPYAHTVYGNIKVLF